MINGHDNFVDKHRTIGKSTNHLGASGRIPPMIRSNGLLVRTSRQLEVGKL